MFTENYAEKKSQGLVEILIKDDAYVLVTKPEPQVTVLNRDNLVIQRDYFQAQADSISELLDDMDKTSAGAKVI